MSLIVIEGVDRTGKSSVANDFESKGFKVIHMSAPPKDTNPDFYLQEMIDVVMEAATNNILLDRSYYGELIWSKVYNRESLLSKQDIEMLRELEDQVGVRRILMTSGNLPEQIAAHWERCVANNEPLDKKQFNMARHLYSAMAREYGFEIATLKDFPDAVQPLPKVSEAATKQNNDNARSAPNPTIVEAASDKTREQLKLERANAINEVLSRRILKGKGPMYDELERSVRHFLNGELGKIFGNGAATAQGFSNDEVEILRFFCKKLKEKDNG